MIAFEEVHKSFRGQKVLDGLNLEIPRGRTTVIIGRSGGGKSVTLKHMIGLMRPDRGRILVDGQDITRLGRDEMNAVRRRFGMLFQEGALFDSMTVGENVAFPLVEHTNLDRAEIGRRVSEMLATVGLPGTEGKMPSELSGGMRKRVGLARALILEPEIVLFDEPTSGLDPIMADAIDRLILRTQRESGRTYVVISHDIPATFKIAHKIAMLYEGRIIAEGTPEEIRENPNPILVQFLRGSAEGPIQVQ
ncbi:MAG: ABC transporter ATP-binding protein [Candidatus Dadabacteria bacterium]|nr:MAG: ABC transporter ATP-binding protein [Candidatus Dadabacteria bacterium]